MSDGRDTICAFIDMQKDFDWSDHDLWFQKLLKYNINENIYRCIKALYNSSIACIKVNKYVIDWFTIGSGVRQGESQPPTLFGLFINDLIKDVKDLKLGVWIRDELISILAFADNIVIIANTEEELQKMLQCIENQCKIWRLKVITGKTNVLHFQNKGKKTILNLMEFQFILLKI